MAFEAATKGRKWNKTEGINTVDRPRSKSPSGVANPFHFDFQTRQLLAPSPALLCNRDCRIRAKRTIAVRSLTSVLDRGYVFAHDRPRQLFGSLPLRRFADGRPEIGPAQNHLQATGIRSLADLRGGGFDIGVGGGRRRGTDEFRGCVW